LLGEAKNRSYIYVVRLPGNKKIKVMKTVWITVGKEDGKIVTKGEFATATEALNLANELNSQYPDRYYDYTHKQIDNKK
tara:strand:+ start:53 stop:289 length:237 start_codon:yes stop_codon:yes gene_type:complete